MEYGFRKHSEKSKAELLMGFDPCLTFSSLCYRVFDTHIHILTLYTGILQSAQHHSSSKCMSAGPRLEMSKTGGEIIYRNHIKNKDKE